MSWNISFAGHKNEDQNETMKTLFREFAERLTEADVFGPYGSGNLSSSDSTGSISVTMAEALGDDPQAV